MVSCPNCKTEISDSSTTCPHCGARVIPADKLEKVPSKTSGWQKIVIAVSVIILIAIGFTFEGAEDRENKAAQALFEQPLADIVKTVARHTSVIPQYGFPAYKLDAQTKSAEVFLEFPRGPMSANQAQFFANAVCGIFSKLYVDKGYVPRHIKVTIASADGKGGKVVYGASIYNGNIDALGWEPAAK